MKNIILLILLITFYTTNFHAQNPLVKQWDKRFGGTDFDLLSSLQQTSDGGYILGGISLSGIGGDKTQPSWGSYDYWIVKIDSLGNKQWDKRYGGTDSDLLTSFQQTSDGGYILGGRSESGISGDKTQPSWGNDDYWIVKIDSLGTKQWDKRFGGTSYELFYSLQQTTDGGYILGGLSWSGISGDKTQPSWGSYDFWIVKISSLGNKQWDKRFGGASDDILYSLQQTTDGGYILGGYSWSGISGDKTQPSWGVRDYWILKIDSLGNKQWDKRFGGTSIDWLNSLQQTTDGGYILGGMSNSGISGDKTQPAWGNSVDYWIVKIDSLGIKQWDKRFGGTSDDEGIGYISQTIDGGFLLSGDSYSPISGDKTENNLGPEQTWVIKTDALGNKQWDKTVFTNGHDEGGLAIKTKDGCFALANYTYAGIGGDKTQASQGSWDYWIIKFCDTTLAVIPSVNLSASDTIFCEKQSINFYDLSLNNPTSWQWYFPGAQPDTSTLQNPTGIYYPSYGQFDVSLKACNAGGCDSLYFPNFITELQNPPAPTVTVNGSLMCSSPAFAYAWYETANLTLLLSSNQCYQPTLPGNYFVIIADSNGCSKPSATIIITAMQNENNHACILTYNGSQLLVQGNCITDSESYVYIYDAQGKEIYVSQLSSSSVNLPLTNNGIYFYLVVSHGVTSQGKFSFQNRMD
ncbi:MAG TPA: hypothetical protein PK736_02625 [Bacteroidia bacterium]|nr:hypothetical protein [Bacteroidia bacterium]